MKTETRGSHQTIQPLIVGLMLLAAIGSAGADETPSATPRSQGFYLGLGVSSVDVSGDFDGDGFVNGGGSMEVMPKLDPGISKKYLFGYQWDDFDVEMSWEESDHDGNWAGIDYPSEYSSLSFDGRYFFGKKIRPFCLAGLGFDALEVQDGSTDFYRFEDATFHGVALRLGGGVHFPLHRRVGLLTQAIYRLGSFRGVDGIADGSLEHGVKANGMVFSVDLRFVFGKKS